MSHRPISNELITILMDHPVLAAQGLVAELAGIRNVKIMRGGHFLGMWKRGIGVYEWFPAGYSQSQHRALTAREATSFTVRWLCPRAAA